MASLAVSKPVARENALPVKALPSKEITICQGSLKKRGHFVPNWKTRHFVLTQHWLGYYASTPKGFTLKGALPLTEVAGVVPSVKKLLNFTIMTTYKKHFAIIAPSEEEAKTWIRMINGTRWNIYENMESVKAKSNDDTNTFIQCLGELELASKPDEVIASLENLLEILSGCFHKQTVGADLRRVALRLVEKKTMQDQSAYATPQKKKLISKVLRMITESGLSEGAPPDGGPGDVNWMSNDDEFGGKDVYYVAKQIQEDHKNLTFKDYYRLGKQLGEGAFSNVYVATLRSGDAKKVAVKVIRKKHLPVEEYENLTLEVGIMKKLSHPNIVKLVDYFDEAKAVFIVTELCEGGELLDRIIDLQHYTEADASKVIYTVAGALEYCHKNGIVHRDLKPENILLPDKSEHGVVKIADFGFAKFFTANGLHTSCGSPSYVAPEILSKKGYGSAVDMWSVGVILYILLSGVPPFWSESQAAMFQMILKGKYTMQEEIWESVSKEAKDLLSKLLVVDSERRLSATEVLAHPWVLKKNLGSLSTRSLTAGLSQLKKQHAREKLRSGMLKVKAAVRLKRMGFGDGGASQGSDSGSAPPPSARRSEADTMRMIEKGLL